MRCVEMENPNAERRILLRNFFRFLSIYIYIGYEYIRKTFLSFPSNVRTWNLLRKSWTSSYVCVCVTYAYNFIRKYFTKKRELPHSTREYIVHTIHRKKNKDNFIRISFCTLFVVLFQKHCFFLVFVTI